MLLSARILNQVTSVNAWQYADQAQWTAGDTVSLFIQLIDLTQDRAVKGYNPAGRRYMPASGATLNLTLANIDQSVQLSRAAVQAYPTSDPSIWRLSVLATDAIKGTCTIQLSLNEGGVITSGSVKAAVLIAGAPGTC